MTFYKPSDWPCCFTAPRSGRTLDCFVPVPVEHNIHFGKGYSSCFSTNDKSAGRPPHRKYLAVGGHLFLPGVCV